MSKTFLPEPLWNTSFSNARDPDWSSMLAAVEKLNAIPKCDQVLYVREPQINGIETVASMRAKLFGMPVKVSSILPKTVKDKDGNEVELIGVMVSGDIDFFMRSAPDQAAKRMVFLTGEIVKNVGE